MPTETEPEMRAHWPRWANFLRQHGLEPFAVWTLEAAGPLALLGAQLLHFGSPLLRPSFSGAAMEGFLELLEDDEERRSFITYLREAGEV